MSDRIITIKNIVKSTNLRYKGVSFTTNDTNYMDTFNRIFVMPV